jgi:hypothetical protein
VCHIQEIRNYLGLQPYIEFFFALNPFKSNFALGLQEMNPQKMGKIHGCALRVWDPRTNTKLEFPAHLADIKGGASLT